MNNRYEDFMESYNKDNTSGTVTWLRAVRPDASSPLSTSSTVSSLNLLWVPPVLQVVTAQIYNITVQLSCLGVRGLELDLHYSKY